MTDVKGNLAFEPGIRKLPFGDIVLTLDTGSFPVKMDLFEKIVAADRLDIYGLSKRNRDAGLGVAFIAVGKKTAELPIKRSSPGTLFMPIEGGIQTLETGSLKETSSFSRPLTGPHVEIDGKSVPLESDLSAQLAYNLNSRFSGSWISPVFFPEKAPFRRVFISSSPSTQSKSPSYSSTAPPAARSGGRKWPIPSQRTPSFENAVSSGFIFTTAVKPSAFPPISFGIH